MRVKEQYPYLKNRLILSLQNYLGITFSVMLLFLLVRVFEFFMVNASHAGLKNLIGYELSGYVFDLTFFFNYSILFFLPVTLLGIIIDFRVVNFLYTLISTFVLLVYSLLVFYFSESLNPLGADVFLYTQEEIELIVGASGAINWLTLLVLLAFIYASFRLSSLFRKINWHVSVLIIYNLISIASISFKLPEMPNVNSYKSEINYYLSTNKLAYFLNSISERKEHATEISYDGFYYDDDLTGKSFKYIDPDNYPFLNIDTTQNVLASYFTNSTTRPNIVFIIVEGLGRSYSGVDADNGSFTPFLDSLASYSLYWENFVSNGGRTFAVLPAILAPAPFGEKGLLEYNNDLPQHQSLIRILKANGYYSSFYHGGNADFDFMKTFMKKQNIDRVIDDKNFPKNYRKMPASKQNFTWGYGDQELFDFYLKSIDTISNPRLDVLLTLSNHSPFKVNNMDKYRKLFEKRIAELGIEGEGKLEYTSYKNIYSCILYTDDAIRNFINNYKKRRDFNNTIFIITGDHRMPEIPIGRRIDHFRVPLLIYSPMVKRPASFKGVSSHLDVTPTLISYLRLNYNIKRPLQQAWLGAELDTSRYFISKKFIPMMRNKNELLDFIDRSNYYSVNRYGQIKDGLNTDESNDLISQQITEGRIKEFRSKNAKVIPNAKLVPDSVYNYSLK